MPGPPDRELSSAVSSTSDTSRTKTFDVNVPFMQLEQHGWDIHAVTAEPDWAAGQGSAVTSVRWVAGEPGMGAGSGRRTHRGGRLGQRARGTRGGGEVGAGWPRGKRGDRHAWAERAAAGTAAVGRRTLRRRTRA